MRTLSSEQVSLKLGNREILKAVSLEASSGQFIGLIGPNGSGKSTWLRALGGLLSYEKGSIEIDGQILKKYSTNQLARIIGYVPQDTTLGFDFRVRDIVLMGRHAHIPRFGIEGPEDYERVEEAMRRTAISYLADRSVMNLSGGQRQMVFIAKALTQEPSILLLDEPISALDINRQLQVLELVRSLVDEGMIAIAALHDLNLAARFCDRLVLLKDGQVLASGKPEDVLTVDTIKESYRVKSAVRYDTMIHSQTITALSYIPSFERTQQ